MIYIMTNVYPIERTVKESSVDDRRDRRNGAGFSALHDPVVVGALIRRGRFLAAERCDEKKKRALAGAASDESLSVRQG